VLVAAVYIFHGGEREPVCAGGGRPAESSGHQFEHFINYAGEMLRMATDNVHVDAEASSGVQSGSKRLAPTAGGRAATVSAPTGRGRAPVSDNGQTIAA
jgi:hypothetical protein